MWLFWECQHVNIYKVMNKPPHRRTEKINPLETTLDPFYCLFQTRVPSDRFSFFSSLCAHAYLVRNLIKLFCSWNFGDRHSVWLWSKDSFSVEGWTQVEILMYFIFKAKFSWCVIPWKAGRLVSQLWRPGELLMSAQSLDTAVLLFSCSFRRRGAEAHMWC